MQHTNIVHRVPPLHRVNEYLQIIMQQVQDDHSEEEFYGFEHSDESLYRIGSIIKNN